MRLSQGDRVNFAFRDGDEDPEAVVSIESLYAQVGDVGSVPAFLMVEVVNQATDLDSAVQDAHARASGLLSLLSVVSNAAVGDISIEVCFEVTDGVQERDFYQHFGDMPPREIVDRLAPQDEFEAFLAHVARSGEFARLHRAVQQYEMAISHSRPGSELLTLAHLWMSAEALTKILLRQELSTVGSQEAVLAAWGIELQNLDAEVRRRVVFGGNTALYREAKRASDGFEHGFTNFGTLRVATASLVPDVAVLIRAAIFRAVDLDPEITRVLQAEPFAVPLAVSSIARELRAVLRGPVENLTADGSAYPHFRLNSRLVSISPTSDGRATYESEEQLEPVFGEGIAWQLTQFGASNPGLKARTEVQQRDHAQE